MTAQIPDSILYENESLSLCDEPLSVWFQLNGMEKSPFQAASTANWRGYVATWEITNKRLYLIEIEGTFKDGSDGSLAALFPGFPDRVFAHWYSGRLRIPRGKLLNYVHMGYASEYEQDILLDIDGGVLTHVEIKENGKAPPDADDGYQVMAATIFGGKK